MHVAFTCIHAEDFLVIMTHYTRYQTIFPGIEKTFFLLITITLLLKPSAKGRRQARRNDLRSQWPAGHPHLFIFPRIF
jgi:hypothetical protein